MHIPVEGEGKYGRLTAYLEAYAADVKAGRCPRRKISDLSAEFYGSSEARYMARVRATVRRINRRPEGYDFIGIKGERSA